MQRYRKNVSSDLAPLDMQHSAEADKYKRCILAVISSNKNDASGLTRLGDPPLSQCEHSEALQQSSAVPNYGLPRRYAPRKDDI